MVVILPEFNRNIVFFFPKSELKITNLTFQKEVKTIDGKRIIFRALFGTLQTSLHSELGSHFWIEGHF